MGLKTPINREVKMSNFTERRMIKNFNDIKEAFFAVVHDDHDINSNGIDGYESDWTNAPRDTSESWAWTKDHVIIGNCVDELDVECRHCGNVEIRSNNKQPQFFDSCECPITDETNPEG